MWEPGTLVLDGRFRLVSSQGKTSATETWVAEQVSLSRKVLLKVLQRDLGVQEGAGERFQREVKRLATVEHPAVLRIIDAGQADQALYLVTEFVDGSPLEGERAKLPMLPERAADLFTQLAAGLAAVHEKGLVHGDLRPLNVLLTKTAKGEQAKLEDFGLGSLMDAPAPSERVTKLARTTGPLERLHLAPEKLTGGAPDTASDVYALGAVAYQLLSGALPDAKAPRPLAEAAKHLADDKALCDAVMSCLRKDPASRPTAAALAKQLATMPKPAEPTLFLEAMQRPPELPTMAIPPPLPEPAARPAPAPAPAAAPAPAPQAPAPLMPSIPMPVVTPTEAGIDPVLAQLAKPPAPAPAPAKRPLRVPWLPLGAALVLAVGVWFLFFRSTPAKEARRLVEMRQPAQALEVLGHALKKSAGDPELESLKVAALHLSQQHKEEESAFKGLGGAKEALDPLVLAGLAEDFGQSEDAALQADLRALPAKEVEDVFRRFAHEPLGPKQWGALRYLDLSKATQGLNLVELYSVSLESNNCAVRKSAAKRLAQLDDDAAEAALLRLRETPREGFEKSCGQDEAAAALKSLKRAR